MPDLEESCDRLGWPVLAIVALDERPARVLGGTQVIGIDEVGADMQQARALSAAFGPEARRRQLRLALERGVEPAPGLADPTAIVSKTCRVGDGTWLNAGVIVGGATFIGDAVFVNRGANIGHHNLLADGVSVGPGVVTAGNVRIGTEAVIGAGATLLPHIRVGDGAVVAAGAVVREDVEPGGFVAGVPARPKPFDRKTSSFTLDEER